MILLILVDGFAHDCTKPGLNLVKSLCQEHSFLIVMRKSLMNEFDEFLLVRTCTSKPWATCILSIWTWPIDFSHGAGWMLGFWGQQQAVDLWFYGKRGDRKNQLKELRKEIIGLWSLTDFIFALTQSMGRVFLCAGKKD
jgi:hypothetical protein